MRRLIVVLAVLIIFLGVWAEIFSLFPKVVAKFQSSEISLPQENVKVVTEESVTIDVVKNVGPSVVTVVEQVAPAQNQQLNIVPFQIFGLPQQSQPQQAQSI